MSSDKSRENMIAKAPMSRPELELAVRAELLDLGPSSWHARLAADYILRAIDEYVAAERARQEQREREVAEFLLASMSDGGGLDGWQAAKWLAAEWHQAVCRSEDHPHEETPWSAPRGLKSLMDEGPAMGAPDADRGPQQ